MSDLVETRVDDGPKIRLYLMYAALLDEWRPVPGYEGYYEVSARGKVRSLVRMGGNNRRYGGQELSCPPDDHGYPHLNLSVKGKTRSFRVHDLVARAFLEEKPDWAECVRHDDGDPGNNWVTNLFWGTDSDNAHDTVRHGRHYWASKETCKYGHDLIQGKNQRYCPVCKPIQDHASYIRRRELASV